MENTEAKAKAEILNSLQGWGYFELKATLGKKAAEIVEEYFRLKAGGNPWQGIADEDGAEDDAGELNESKTTMYPEEV